MLFNLDDRGPQEIQQLTGIYLASNDFSVIASELADATNAVAALVGDAVITAAEEGYSYGDEFPLTFAVRKAIAVLAVSRYTRNNLIAHGDHGAKVVADQNEKVPFEWMVDRDQQAQQERWYRSMDALYKVLEDTEEESWMHSDIRKRYKASIVRSLSDFERVYPVDGSYYVYYMLQSLVIEAQPKIRRMIGAEVWDVMVGESPQDLHKALLPLCQRYAILSALITAVRRWNLEVFPIAIARRFAPTYQGNRSSRVALKEEMDAFIEGIEGQLEDIREEIAEELQDGNPAAGFDLMPKGDRRNKYFSAQ
jgi:hypothetical protein